MLLIAEIILTIFVWRKGWAWYSLIPIGVTFMIGMIIGFSGNVTNLSGVFVFDIMAIIALIIMLNKKPNKIEKT